MKTMKLGTDTIVRVSEKDVESKLAVGYKFCTKSEWKEKVRVIKKKKEEIKENLEAKTSKRGKNSENIES